MSLKRFSEQVKKENMERFERIAYNNERKRKEEELKSKHSNDSSPLNPRERNQYKHLMSFDIEKVLK